MKNPKFRAKKFFVHLSVYFLIAFAIASLTTTVIHGQASNPWNIQRNTSTNDLDFYLNSNGISGASLQLKANGSARVRSIYDLDDNSNTYRLDPNTTSVLNALNVTTLNASAINTPGLTSFSLPTNGAIIYLPEISGNTNYTGIAAANGFMSDGVPWYGGFGREGGGWGYPYPDYVISNHTGLRLVAHGGYGGISLYDQYNWSTGTWTSSGTEIARFRPDPAGGSYMNSRLDMTAYNPLNFTYAGYSTPNGTFRLTPNVHINTPTNYGVIVNWDNGSNGDASVGQFVVGNGAGGVLFRTLRSGVTESNFYHTYVNDSWFPYVNGWNYLRGYTYAFNAPWYDENNPGYYLDLDQQTHLNVLYPNSINCMYAWCPQNQVMRLTPNLHLNSVGGYGMYVNWDNGGASGGTYQLVVGNGGGAYAFIARADGSLYSAASGWIASDERLKTNIQPVSKALDKIRALEGVTFEYRKDIPNRTPSEGTHLGLIAQQVEKVIPEVVGEGPEGYKTVAYTDLIPVLIEGTKEQQALIDNLSKDLTSVQLDTKNELELIKQELEQQKDINKKQNYEIDTLKAELEQLKQEFREKVN